MKVDIRSARVTDAPALSEIAFHAKSHWEYPDVWLQSWREELMLSPDDLLTHTTFVAVAESSRPVGFCVLDVAGASAAVEHLWIAPAYHGHGIGRAPLQRSLDAARVAGATRPEVSDPFAEWFYLQMAARRLGEVPASMPGAADRTLPLLELALPRSSGGSD